MRLEVLPQAAVHHDARGDILTWLPPDPIVEYNLVTIRAGSVRGLHWHPHFTEYLLFIQGSGHIVSRNINGGPVDRTEIRPALSTRAQPGVAHAVYADTDLTFIAMLTRPWHLSNPPILPFDIPR